MIQLNDKADCCGCEACVQRCPVHCIGMRPDEEGFLYPVTDTARCTDCGLCERVCPVIRQQRPRRPLKVYAAKNQDEKIREQSSSGGIFTLLAEDALRDGGVVFGARFDPEWNVVHAFAETPDRLDALRGSKYVQSRIGETFRQAERFLKEGRRVLFSGTPCQIAGLRLFLRKEYDGLLTADVVCHGVPSPAVWRKYLDEIARPEGAAGKNTVSLSLDEKPVITGISFRDKKSGWKKFGFVVRKSAPCRGADQNSVLLSEILHKNLYMQGFLHNLYLRPSCHDCPAKSGKSGSDITLADYWGIGEYYPAYDDDRGVSLLLVNTPRGLSLVDRLVRDSIETSYGEAFRANPTIEESVPRPERRQSFFDRFGDEPLPELIGRLCRPTFRRRIRGALRYVLSQSGLLPVAKKIIRR